VYLIDEFCEDQRVKRKKGPKEVRYMQNVKRGKREQGNTLFQGEFSNMLHYLLQ